MSTIGLGFENENYIGLHSKLKPLLGHPDGALLFQGANLGHI